MVAHAIIEALGCCCTSFMSERVVRTTRHGLMPSMQAYRLQAGIPRATAISRIKRSRRFKVRALGLPGRSKQQQLVQLEHAEEMPLPPALAPLKQTPAFVWSLLLLQAVALVGALVGGILARKRRLELLGLNQRLRQINSELRKRTAEEDPVCSADAEAEAMRTYKLALESAMGGPSAAHPVEGFGDDNLSLAQARRALSQIIREGRTALFDKQPGSALDLAKQAEAMAAELQDKRASRAVLRLKATALRQVGDLRGALSALEETMLLSDALGDCSHDADVLGEIADTHADMGDFEKAGQVYDRCILAIQNADSLPPSTSTWDC